MPETAALIRHNTTLLLREPGPLLSRMILPLAFLLALRPLYTAAQGAVGGTELLVGKGIPVVGAPASPGYWAVTAMRGATLGGTAAAWRGSAVLLAFAAAAAVLAGWRISRGWGCSAKL